MLRAKDGGTAQGKHQPITRRRSYPEPSHHPLRAAFSAISSKAYGWTGCTSQVCAPGIRYAHKLDQVRHQQT